MTETLPPTPWFNWRITIPELAASAQIWLPLTCSLFIRFATIRQQMGGAVELHGTFLYPSHERPEKNAQLVQLLFRKVWLLLVWGYPESSKRSWWRFGATVVLDKVLPAIVVLPSHSTTSQRLWSTIILVKSNYAELSPLRIPPVFFRKKKVGMVSRTELDSFRYRQPSYKLTEQIAKTGRGRRISVPPKSIGRASKMRPVPAKAETEKDIMDRIQSSAQKRKGLSPEGTLDFWARQLNPIHYVSRVSLFALWWKGGLFLCSEASDRSRDEVKVHEISSPISPKSAELTPQKK